MEYKPSALQSYIEKSESRVVNDGFRVRLSADLARKYDAGVYDNAIALHTGYINDIKNLGIQYPGNANPVFYMYVVPDDNFVELLSFPFLGAVHGGKPVSSFDLDGFDAAYGVSQNLLENHPQTESIARRVNGIHEFAHLVHGLFFNRDRMFNEGFAEILPLYTMDLESQFDEHRAVIKNMTEADIFTAQELLDMGRDGSFGHKTRVANKTCSFDWAYISSYLFLRGYIMRLAEKFGLNRVAATQKFLEILRSSQCFYQFLIYDLARVIDVSGDEMLDGKMLQVEAIKSL